MDELDPKLLKVVALAKAGIGGEKENAIAIVRRLCEQHNLDFDDVMGAEEKVAERALYYKHDYEENVAAAVVFRFGATKEHPDVNYNKHRRVMFFEGTIQQYVECLNAMDAYLRVYRRERKRILNDLPGAFIAKHRLWTQWDDSDDRPERKPPTLEERQASYRRAQLGEAMLEDVKVQKRIGE